MDIQIFTYGGSEQAGGVIHSEKLKNHKNSTHSKIKFCIISIEFFFSSMDVKIFVTEGWTWAG